MSGSYSIRALDPAERFIWLLDRISCANFLMMAELTGHPISTDELRAGLDRLQASHPLLSAELVENADGTVEFHRLEGARIPLEVEDRSEEDWHEAIAAQFNARFDDPGLPLARCQLLRLPKRSVISLIFHHPIADGRSGLLALTELLRLCLRGVAPPVAQEAPPPMHSLFPAEFQWKDHPAKAAELGQQMMQEFLRYGMPAELPFLAHKEPRREPQLKRIQLDAARGRRLQERCRAEGASVHGAICAAHLIATRGLLEEGDAKTLYLMCPADIRPHLAQDIGDQLSYCTTFVRSNHRVEGPSDFWTLAREIAGDLKRRIQRGDGHLTYTLLPLDQIGSAGPAFDAFLAGVEQLPAGSNVSNLGRIPPLDDCPEIESISGALCSLPKHLASLNCTSYKDQLLINLTYDGAKLAPEVADRLVGDVERLLGRAAAAQDADAAV